MLQADDQVTRTHKRYISFCAQEHLHLSRVPWNQKSGQKKMLFSTIG